MRLVKGAYSELGRIAHRGIGPTRQAYTSPSEQLWRAGADVGGATHEPPLHRAARRLATESPASGYWDFQMLYGERWYPYLMRRIAERPSNALFALRAVVGR